MTQSADQMRELLASNNVVLGPMAGISEAPFRGICKRMGAGLTYTEMIGAKGLHYNPGSATARKLLTFSPEETPCAVQLFGADPEIMADQAAKIVDEYGSDVACIDINMGCPVTKVVAKGEGSALMRTPALAASIVAEVAAACPGVPITVKFRKGWDDDSVNAIEFAATMEAAGAAALAVHGRTRAQQYRGKADWEIIRLVKESVTIPVIGSGDVFSAEDAKAMLEFTRADAVMIARGAQGNPWIFREARSLIDFGIRMPEPTGLERIDMAIEHAAALIEFAGPRAIARMRKHVAWYVAGMPGASLVRQRVNSLATYEELTELLAEYRAYIEPKLSA